MMKSQVNALLHVTEGLHKDILLTYPALEESFLKDMGRLRLYCQSRGRGVYTLDLPHLESLLLKGIECGRLLLEGPLSRAVSNRIKVPRLYSGLWLRVFDRDACLKHEVDVNAFNFLRQLLTVGKKLEVECSFDRTQAVVGAYHDIESRLRRPTLRWSTDDLGLEDKGETISDISERASSCGNTAGEHVADLYHGIRNSSDICDGDSSLLLSASVNEVTKLDDQFIKVSSRVWNGNQMSVHLAQALDYSTADTLPLFNSLRERNGDSCVQHVEDQTLLHKVQKVADLIVGKLQEYDPVLYSEHLESTLGRIGFKHGPGAVAEGTKNWEKSQFPYWPIKLSKTFPFGSCAKVAGDDREQPRNHEVASRLIAVPKTSKGPRLIAAEQASHQWCQQLTWKFLQDECRRIFRSSFIDFRKQSLSGDLVLAASRDRKMATVDLSDASDRLTCWTVERMFRRSPSLLTALHAARTRYLRDEISEKLNFLGLRKFASQGTATTFPVMSMVMLFIALGSCIEGKVTYPKILRLRDQVRVFGDDIIIPSHGYGRLVRCMELLELKVNMAKSYVNGHFRESCGVDGFMGYDVTPVKPKHIVADSPASCQAIVDTSNNLFNKGYWHASTACLDLLPPRLRRGLRVVGRNDAGFSGLTSFSGSDERHLDKRWNTRLHRTEVRVWQLSDRPRKRPRDGYPALLDFFTSSYSHEQARTVSEYADSRKTRSGFLWEPSNSDSYTAESAKR